MALGPRLDLRQTQSLVMTPQLQQAIRLLALSNIELESFIADAIADNPLVTLDTGEGESAVPEPAAETAPQAGEGDGEAALDLTPDSDFQTGEAGPSGGTGSQVDMPLRDIGETASSTVTLHEHLDSQVGGVAGSALQLSIARHIIGQLDEAGYLSLPLQTIAGDLGASEADAEAALAMVQSLDPTGVGARDLAECLALQAKEADRFDPCMEVLLSRLDLLAAGDFARLRRMCGVDEDDFADMVAELRRYDPKPGCRFGGDPVPAVHPDVFVAADGADWKIAINRQTLPRVLVDREYYTELRAGCDDKAARGWLSEKLADAGWLAKALDQRQKTILKVAREIVKRQEGFFRKGVSALVPLTLREVAETIDMHESTISRVTSAKYLGCSRGTFELKYFFSSGVAAKGEDGGASAQAVKAAIRELIDAETADRVLSDDALVKALDARGYSLARRTVAKYREALGLGSSVQRRRQKKLDAVG